MSADRQRVNTNAAHILVPRAALQKFPRGPFVELANLATHRFMDAADAFRQARERVRTDSDGKALSVVKDGDAIVYEGRPGEPFLLFQGW
jgi:hypothetical protein